MSTLLVHLTHDGNPMPAPRPRHDQTHAYNPDSYTDYKTALAWALKSAAIRERRIHKLKIPYTGPVHVMAGFMRATRGKVDLDNLLKSCLDAMLGVVIADDDQVREIRAWKDLANPRPHLELEVWTA